MLNLSGLEWLGLTVCSAYTFAGLWLLVGISRIPYLAEQRIPATSASPGALSVIIAARNEAETIIESLQTLLESELPLQKVIVVNDRSSDATSTLLALLAQTDSRIQVITVEALPSGWIGKNHALWLGAQAATGTWLLFTDADAHYGPKALTRAMAAVNQGQLDHLTVIPQLWHQGFGLHGFSTAFSLFFNAYHQPWKIHKASTPQWLGMGAFNLIKAQVYEEIGGHQAIRCAPDDDMQLGRLVKQAGFKQAALWGLGEVAMPWYDSAMGLCRGLVKNAYPLMGYSPQRVMIGVLGLLILGFIIPLLLFASLRIADNATLFWMLLLNTGLFIVLYNEQSKRLGASFYTIILFPISLLAFCGVLLASMTTCLVRRGIVWRDTFYPLEWLQSSRAKPIS